MTIGILQNNNTLVLLSLGKYFKLKYNDVNNAIVNKLSFLLSIPSL